MPKRKMSGGLALYGVKVIDWPWIFVLIPVWSNIAFLALSAVLFLVLNKESHREYNHFHSQGK